MNHRIDVEGGSMSTTSRKNSSVRASLGAGSMTRRTCLGLMTAAAAGTTLGCASTSQNAGSDSASSADSSKKTQLSVWLAPIEEDTEGLWKPLLTDFEEKNNCEVNLEIIPWATYEEKWSAALSGGEGPDVGYMYVEMFPTYITAGAVVDMNDMFTDDDRKEYIYLDRGYMMGGQYGAPINTGRPFVLYYNTDILESLGEQPPETWEDFARICEKATQDTDGDGKIDQYGYAVGLSAGDMSPLYILNAYIYRLIWQAGGDIFNDDLKSVRFNDAAGVEALNFFKSLQSYMPENVLSLSSTDAFSTIFGQGKAAFGIQQGRLDVEASMASSYPDLNWDFVTSLKHKEYGTFGAADSLTLMSGSKHPDLAFEFIKYVTGAEFQTALHAAGGSGVPLTQTELETFDAPEKMKRIITTDRDKWRPLQAGPNGSEILENLASHVQMIMEDRMSVEDALNESVDFGNEVVSEFWAENS